MKICRIGFVGYIRNEITCSAGECEKSVVRDCDLCVLPDWRGVLVIGDDVVLNPQVRPVADGTGASGPQAYRDMARVIRDGIVGHHDIGEHEVISFRSNRNSCWCRTILNPGSHQSNDVVKNVKTGEPAVVPVPIDRIITDVLKVVIVDLDMVSAQGLHPVLVLRSLVIGHANTDDLVVINADPGPVLPLHAVVPGIGLRYRMSQVPSVVVDKYTVPGLTSARQSKTMIFI